MKVAAVFVAGLFSSLPSWRLLASAVSPYAGFGVQSFGVSATERPTAEQVARHELGAPDVQAGSHPFAFTTSFVMNEPEEESGGNYVFAVGRVEGCAGCVAAWVCG